jgi:hypothetical protein
MYDCSRFRYNYLRYQISRTNETDISNKITCDNTKNIK